MNTDIEKHPLEKEVLSDYTKKYEVYINICYLLHQAGLDKDAKDLYELSMKKAAGCKMMMDYLNKTDIIPRK